MEELRRHLIQGIEYDLWANLQWVEVLEQITDAEPVMRHVAWANQIWLGRVCGSPLEAEPDIALQAQLKDSAAHWREILAGEPPARAIEWTRIRDGVHQSGTLESIVRHVINHGTYHRGQLRGLAQSQGFDAFPETDFILFANRFPQN